MMPSDVICPYCKQFIGKPYEERVVRELEQHYWIHKLEQLTSSSAE